MKARCFIFLCCWSVMLTAQSTKDNLILQLKQHPQKDTLRCDLLSKLIEEEPDNVIWMGYNNELKEIAQKEAHNPSNSEVVRNAFTKYLSIAYNNEGANYIYTDQYNLAIKSYLASYRLTSKLHFHYGNSLALQNIGTAYDFIGKLDSALYYLKKAYEEAVVSGDKSSIAYVSTDLGYVYNNLGDNELAIKYNINALKLFEALNDDAGKERTNFAIGRIFDSQKDYTKSLPYYNTCLDINRKLKDEFRVSLILTSLANVYVNLNREEEAISQIEKAIPVCQRINNVSGLASCYKFYGDIYFEKKELDKAMNYYQQSADIYKTIESGNFYAKVLIQLAGINLLQNNLNRAEEQALQGFEISRASSYPSENKNAAEILSKIYVLKNNFKKAYDYKTIAANISDSIYFDESRNIALKADFKYDAEKKETAIKELTQEKTISNLQSQRKSILIYCIIGGIGVILLIAYFLFSRYKTQKQNELLKIQLEEAQKTIDAEKKAAESELKALKSQMNPHFIFNALNSIQEQFMYGDKLKGNEQLGNFTYLTRQILTVSGKKQIPLSTEIEILQKYLELEKMRFQNDFDYSITFSDRIDEDYLQLPPMLIQPFVENSIKHGLLHKQGHKALSVHFDLSDQEDVIVCTVQDNGIGREKSAEIKAGNAGKHASFSTGSIEQRLELLNQNLKLNKLIVYEDLKDGNNMSTGTRVIIKIPLA